MAERQLTLDAIEIILNYGFLWKCQFPEQFCLATFDQPERCILPPFTPLPGDSGLYADNVEYGVDVEFDAAPMLDVLLLDEQAV